MCNCLADTNNLLAEHNAQLLTTLFGDPPRIVITTIKRDEKKRGKPPSMLASFCPFCGEKHPADKREAETQEQGG